MRLAAGLIAAALSWCGQGAFAAPPDVITKAEYTEPTRRYAHGVLGDDIEWGAIRLTVDKCAGCAARDLHEVTIRLPETRVFEDVAPRLVDLEGDGTTYVLVVESDASKGARLALYDANGVVTATRFIGRKNRWLAPIGAADLDGDGHAEIAYIDRPHLVKALRVFRFRDGKLREVASLKGFTNNSIGERDIAGGMRTCAGAPEMIVATADWSRLQAVTLRGRTLAARDIGPHEGRESFAAALECR